MAIAERSLSLLGEVALLLGEMALVLAIPCHVLSSALLAATAELLHDGHAPALGVVS